MQYMAKKIVFYILVVWMYYPSLFLGGLGVVVGFGFFLLWCFLLVCFFLIRVIFSHTVEGVSMKSCLGADKAQGVEGERNQR